MSKIVCKLFGIPQITKDGQPVFLPYAKISALLYYILVTRVVSRDEAAGLLWPDESDEAARRSLRNAIYQAKKALGVDIILSPKKSILMLNETLDLTVDVDQFLQDPQQNLHLYTGEFLQGFFLKDSEPYEFWLVKMRNYYKEKFSSECSLKIEDGLRSQDYKQVEGHIRHLIEIDEYDERSFRLLMRFYQETGRNGKAIETYYELAKFLRQELGVSPDQTTKEIYERSLEEMHVETGQSRSDDDIFFFGRYEKLAALEKALKDFKEKREGCKSLMIVGEPGSGKSTIKRRVLAGSANDFFILETQGLPSEQDLPFRPWRAIARSMLDLIRQNDLIQPALWQELMSRVFPDFQESLPTAEFLAPRRSVSLAAIVHIMVEALRTLASRRQVLLVFEDLQWLDADSLHLLTSVLLETPPDQVMLVATCSQEHNRALDDTVAALNHSGRLFPVELERFTIETCHRLMEKALPERDLNGELLERVYNETEGTPFFLVEYIGMLKNGEALDPFPPAIREFLRTRLINLSQEALELAGTISFFYDGVSLEFLARVVGKATADLIFPLGALTDRRIITERGGGPVLLSFSHSKLREYLYQTQTDSRKQVIHRKIALLLERDLDSGERSGKQYAQLTYHFSAAGDHLKALKYRIASLNYHLDFSHEIFPMATGEEVESDPVLYISRDKIKTLFRNLESDIHSFRSTAQQSEELELLEMEFFYMKGRYSILEGDYESGVNDISYVIQTSQQVHRTDYTFEGYRQLIYYYIQISDPKGMAKYIEPALDLAVQCNNHKEIGVLLRLKGLYNMMTGNYCLAEKLLTESINTLAITERAAKHYAVNIAAGYDYIGEIRQAQEDYTGALELFDKAISLCPGNALSSLSVFYINAGKSFYFLKDYAAAKSYFERAYNLYGQFDSFWLRPTLDAYMALTLLKERKLDKALERLNAARQNMWRINYPSDLGTVHFAEALIRNLADRDEQVRAVFQTVLPESADHYYQLALKHLSQHLDQYEINYLNKELDRTESC